MTGRPFHPPSDYRKVQHFLAEMRQRVSQAAYFQFGDLLWRTHYYENAFDPTTDLRIWQDADGRIVGIVYFLAPDNNPEFFIRPELYDSVMAEEMLIWAIARAKVGHAQSIETSCIQGDKLKTQFLELNGFHFVGDPMVFMERQLINLPEKRPLSPYYTMLNGDERLDLPSITGTPMTAPHYQQLVNAPGYKNNLALRICYRGREIASGAICWHDAVDACGQFEPVGTAKAHRGKGLAYSALSQMMSNLQQYGAKHVYVRTDKANTPAIRLYQKLGFRMMAEDDAWALRI